MDLDLVNQSLKRTIKNGREYNKYFANVNCTPTYLGAANTDFTLKMMKKWSLKYYQQSKAIANVLKGDTISETIENIHQFLYNHIQYEIDGANQLLLSPACSWVAREKGNDCKSYSIFASTILLNLGIEHFFRKVKQPNLAPNDWSHVYVVVPVDNKTYKVIDATISPNIEVNYTLKQDLKMNKLKHYGLNATSLGCGCDGVKDNTHQDYGLGFSFGDLSNLFGDGWSPSCIGGTVDSKDVKVVKDGMAAGSNVLYAAFNNALSTTNLTSITQTINAIISESAAVNHKASRMAGYNWTSRCSKDSTKAMHKITMYYNDFVTKLFLPYLNRFFTFNTGVISVNNQDYSFDVRKDGQGIYKPNFNGNVNAVSLSNVEFKAGLSTIPTFVLDSYTAENVQSSSFDVEAFLNALDEVAAEVQNGSNNGSNNNGGIVDYNGNNNGGDMSQAGFNPVVPIVLLSAAIGAYFYNKNKDNKQK